ncbi:MAG: YbaK/EbsC family protein [Candidatus Diapherotrites archaeon]|nr:YbaK/EbsC family protein [Candidatus Diapherotrites archaeon]
MIEDFIKANQLKAKLIFCSKKVHTVQQAANFMKVPVGEIAKSILFILDNNEPVLAIVSGDKKVSARKLQKIFNSKTSRMATPKEVEEITGYEVGAVPPISVYGVQTVIDKTLASKPQIICGGGSEQHLLCISSEELLEFGFEIRREDISE